MSSEIDYQTLAEGKATCAQCGQSLGLRDITRTLGAATFGHSDRKVRVTRCPNCGKENQFQSER